MARNTRTKKVSRNAALGIGAAGSGAALLGGLAAGAVLMYLMDPEKGAARRGSIRSGAHDAFSHAGSVLADASHAAMGSLHSAHQHVHGHVQDRLEQARAHADEVHAQAHSLIDNARSRVSGLVDRVLHRQPQSHSILPVAAAVAAPVAVVGVGTAALLGLAAVYFLDSKRGAARRQSVKDLAGEFVASTCELSDWVINKVTGGVEQTEYASSDQYEEGAPTNVADPDFRPQGVH